MDNIEDIKNKNTKYIIIKKIGRGGTSKVFLVQENGSDKQYIAKVLKEKTDEKKSKRYFINEINILNIFKNNLYIPQIKNSGIGKVERTGRLITKNRYLILEYEEKGNLFDYVYFPFGFSEEHAKLIFYKILKGIQVLHKENYCHRDIKLPNILLDSKYNPKIADFGFATLNSNKLERFLGTKRYKSPQIMEKIPYNGIKNDIFSLGQTLIYLMTRKNGIKEDAKKKDELYSLIIDNKKEDYWKNFENDNLKFSPEFKRLYFEMCAYNEEERPKIEAILNSDWLKEIKDLIEKENKDENETKKLKDLEDEVRKEFERRADVIKLSKGSETEYYGIGYSSELGTIKRGLEDKRYFNDEVKLKTLPKDKYYDNYIKIKMKISSVTFMNKLIKQLSKKYGKKCAIIPSPYTLKFSITFKEENENKIIIPKVKEELEKLQINEKKFKGDVDENKKDEEKEDKEEEESEEILIEESTVEAKLYKIKDNEYLLGFTKKAGETEEYYQNVQKIKDEVINLD